jgi:hypothetical protein
LAEFSKIITEINMIVIYCFFYANLRHRPTDRPACVPALWIDGGEDKNSGGGMLEIRLRINLQAKRWKSAQAF